MCTFLRKPALTLLTMVLILLGPSWSAAAKDYGSIVLWERIEGITPVVNVAAQTINGILPVGFPWSVTDGKIRLDLNKRRIKFFVKGLSIGAMPAPVSPMGTTGVVTAIKGTVVCTRDGLIIDTDAVELSPDGNASIKGVLPDDLESCDPEGMVFLLRIAEIIPGAQNITERWLAYGAVRGLLGKRG